LILMRSKLAGAGSKLNHGDVIGCDFCRGLPQSAFRNVSAESF
jgi:hypothetical protein